MTRAEDGGIIKRDAPHQFDRIDILHEPSANQVVESETGDGDDRGTVHLGIVQPVQQMDSAWARSGDAGTKLAGMLGEAAGHKGGCFLVPYADITDFVLTYTDGLDQRP